MKINIDIPLNIGDAFYYITNYHNDEILYELDDIEKDKVDSFVISKDGVFILNDIKDWHGRADRMDCPISTGEVTAYTTRENAEKAIIEWNKTHGKESD